MYRRSVDTIPQRPPFVFLDKILDLETGKRIVGLKNLSYNEPFFSGNIPDYPIMPSSLFLECLTQTASALIFHDSDLLGRRTQFREVKKLNFLKEAKPGDVLRIEVHLVQEKAETLYFEGRIFCEGAMLCEGEFSFQMAEIPSKPKIHATASVHPTAQLGKDVTVGPYAIIGEHVFIGEGTVIEAHAMIDRWTKIGENNHIHFGTVIGSKAQDGKYLGEKSWVIIGNNNEIREYVTINRATGKDAVTVIGDNNMFLTNAHIGHNCELGSGITLANAVALGGHTVIEDNAIIGGLTGVHQFVRIGKGTMTGGYSRLIQDVPPFMLCDGNPAHVRGLNAVGLKRRGVKGDSFRAIKDAYKLLYRSGQNVQQALDEIRKLEKTDELVHLIAFLEQDTSRGISKKTETPSSDSE